jgi:hypothetical protein
VICPATLITKNKFAIKNVIANNPNLFIDVFIKELLRVWTILFDIPPVKLFKIEVK